MAVVEVKNLTTIVLDIEGTLCPIWFVSRVLYPYATENLEKTVRGQWNEDEFASYKAAFPADVQASPYALINHCLQLTSKDIKDPAWKKLQGLIWRTGYADGVLSVPLFQDVGPSLEKWHQQKYVLSIFSSGSVLSQKLFFGYVNAKTNLPNTESVNENQASKDEELGEVTEHKNKAGVQGVEGSLSESHARVETENLNYLFSQNFDTVNAGPKTIRSSYELIVRELGTTADSCLFLSDNVKEIVAAEEAGLQALLVDRPGNATLSEEDRRQHQIITSLDQIDIVGAS